MNDRSDAPDRIEWSGAAAGTVVDPRYPGLVPVQGRSRPRALRREGQESPEPGDVVLRHRPHGTHAADGRRRRHRRVDPGAQRGGGAVPRVQPDPEAPPPLQHPVQRRQVLPVPRRHPRRGMAPCNGAARCEAQGSPLLRTVCARVCDPGNPRPAPPHVPDPHVHEGQVRPVPASRPALPLRAHREVCGALCGLGHARGVRGAGQRAAPVPRWRYLADPRPTRQADARIERRARVRAGGTPARPDRLGAQGHRATDDGRCQRRGLRRHRHRRRRARSLGAGVPREEGARRRPQGPDRRQGGGPHPTGARWSPARAALRRCRSPRHPPRGPRPRSARRPRALRAVPRRSAPGEGAPPRPETRRET